LIEHNEKKYKVIAVTPAGREKYLSVLCKYIKREMDKGLIDGWQLWQNTNIQSDIDYIHKLASEDTRIEVKEIEGLGAYDAYNIHLFFRFAQDYDTIYLRFDDDIVYLQEDAVKNLLYCRLNNSEPFIMSANIVNNTVMSKLHQDIGALTKHTGEANGERMGELAWKDPTFAEHVHKTFQDKVNRNAIFEYQPPTNFEFKKYKEFSISCFAFFGREAMEPDRDEEMWISSWRPQQLQRSNMVCANAIVVHFAYHTQRPYLDTKPEYYQFYKELSDKI
jgi:hypothetical protein